MQALRTSPFWKVDAAQSSVYTCFSFVAIKLSLSNIGRWDFECWFLSKRTSIHTKRSSPLHSSNISFMQTTLNTARILEMFHLQVRNMKLFVKYFKNSMEPSFFIPSPRRFSSALISQLAISISTNALMSLQASTHSCSSWPSVTAAS